MSRLESPFAFLLQLGCSESPKIFSIQGGASSHKPALIHSHINILQVHKSEPDVLHGLSDKRSPQMLALIWETCFYWITQLSGECMLSKVYWPELHPRGSEVHLYFFPDHQTD